MQQKLGSPNEYHLGEEKNNGKGSVNCAMGLRKYIYFFDNDMRSFLVVIRALAHSQLTGTLGQVDRLYKQNSTHVRCVVSIDGTNCNLTAH